MNYDIIVIGGGHAGIEASEVAGKMGLSVALLTFSKSEIGVLSCNPAIGGLAKSHVVKELDGLGAIMPRVADITALQYRILNKRKGAAVRATRTQNHRSQYPKIALELLQQNNNVQILETEALSLIIENKKVIGVETALGQVLAKAVIVCSGTFLRGKIHTGKVTEDVGRRGSPDSIKLANSLINEGFNLRRFKTGTPARIDKSTVDFTKMEEQQGESSYFSFSVFSPVRELEQTPCWMTATTEQTHKIIRDNLHSSAMYGGGVDAIGARYCPSVEDKVVRFSHHPSHKLILEPEGDDSIEMYLNGFSNSLPKHVQEELLQTIPGLENSRMTQLAYAIEYDVIDPMDLHLTMEHIAVENLYFAGQVNGTSGYEEAAGQGIVAGINAAAKICELDDYRPNPSNSYIGVMISDITSQGVDEPYRLFTSRADFRLLLREDNALSRMLPIAKKYQLFSNDELEKVDAIERKVIDVIERAKATRLSQDIYKGKTAWDYLREPKAEILSIVDEFQLPEDSLTIHRLQIEAKYSGYIQKEKRRLLSIHKVHRYKIPQGIDWLKVPGLTAESIERLRQKLPKTLGEAQGIRGISKAHVVAILSYIKNNIVSHET